MELHLGMEEELTKSLWVRIKGRAGTGDIIVGVCYRPPDQGDRADEALYRQIGAASRSQALVLMGDFNHPDICWRDNAAECKQSRKFLECVDDNFLLQVTEEPTRRGAMLDLVLTNKEGLVGECEAQGQPWLQCPRNGGVQDPQGSEESAEQAPYPGLQESRLWPLQGPAW
ncbi:hypothetical protein GRJ2_003451600 [Grus japonensis]|uniref:Endonuclease/exonuclease/phosphatase domain-containing protein n=1 Tax=Grus japonensis TaxID=30415 RepID=A0ABC9YK44_GRUJA